MDIKVALPKGRLLRKTAAMLQKADWGLDEYHSKMGFYRPRSQKFPALCLRVFHEKDIPIQVAMGNYDLGICGSDWVEELLVKYPSSDLVKARDLGYGEGTLYLAASSTGKRYTNNGVRIASEYPNLAEAFALKSRLGRFSIFPLWGAAEVYPPENADMVLLSAMTEADLAGFGIKSVSKVLNFSAFLIVNRNSWETKNLGEVMASLHDALSEEEKKASPKEEAGDSGTLAPCTVEFMEDNDIRLALPDGHQQQPMVELFNKSGIRIDDYPSATGNRRPRIKLEGVSAKVIRPQDMPLQVANGYFDLAITGRDWLKEHLYQFPSSPVQELLNLGLGKVRLVAVVSRELNVNTPADLRTMVAEKGEPLRLASEYVNIADKYARENHIGHYRVIPTWGATEAFLPEDADLLIENTETGRTIARHNLKIIDTLFESTACIIGNTAIIYSSGKSKIIDTIVNKLRVAVEGA